jgi:hypothetical protein
MADEKVPMHDANKKPGEFIPKPQAEGPTPEKEFVPGPVGRGLQSALIGQAFESFGKAFTGGGYTPVGQAPRESAGMSNWRDAGNEVQGALEARWYQAEFKNFRNAELKEFQTNMKGVVEESKFLNKELDRGLWHEAGIEGEVTRLDLTKEADRLTQVQLRGQLQADMITRIGEMQMELGNQAAEKYRQNPIINKMVTDLYAKASQSLMTQFNPTAALKTAESMVGIRESEAAIRASDAQARSYDAQAAATTSKPPTGLHDAYKQGGASMLDSFINGTDEGLGLWEQVRAGYEEKLKEDFARSWRRGKGKNVTKNADLKMKADFAAAQDKLRRVAQYRWVRDALGQSVADELQKQNPGYGPDPVEPPEPAVKGAVSPKEGEQKADKFAGIALDRYSEWMSEQPPETTMEEGIDFILNEWLPRALDGDVPNHEEHGEYILDNLTAGTSKAAAAYRSLVKARIRDQLRAKAGSGKGGKKLQPHQKVGGGRGPGRKGGLSRAGKGLLGDDVYAEKAPPLPPEPEI